MLHRGKMVSIIFASIAQVPPSPNCKVLSLTTHLPQNCNFSYYHCKSTLFLSCPIFCSIKQSANYKSLNYQLAKFPFPGLLKLISSACHNPVFLEFVDHSILVSLKFSTFQPHYGLIDWNWGISRLECIRRYLLINA